MNTRRTSFPTQSPRALEPSNETLMHLLRCRDLWLPPLLVLARCPFSASLVFYTSKIHPDRSARFARSLAALALPSWAVLGLSLAVLGHLGAIVRRLGAILSRRGHILDCLGAYLERLGVFASSFTHVSHILAILKPFWPERLPQEPPQNGTC